MTDGPEVAALTLTRRPPAEEAEKRPLEFGLIVRLFRHTGGCRRLRDLLFVLVIVRALQLPALAWAVGAVIDGPIRAGDWPGTLWGAAGFGLLALSTQLVFVWRQRFGQELGEHVVHDLRRLVFAHLLRMPLSFFHAVPLGRLISRLTSDIESVRAGVQNCLFVTLVQSGQMLGAAALMVWIDPVLFLLVLGTAPVVWGLSRLLRRRIAAAMRANLESFSRVTATLAESVRGVRVTQGFAREDRNAELFSSLIVDHSRYGVGIARVAGLFVPALACTGQVLLALLLLLGGWRVLDPGAAMPIGSLVRYVFLAGVFFGPLQHLGHLYNEALTAMAGAERVFRLLDTEPEWQDLPEAVDPGSIAGRVEFRGVGFAYVPGRPVLHGIDLVAEPGQTIALVGPTGSGKSTITHLLAKFYLPGCGSITIDGRDLAQIRGDALHRRMGLISQENILFPGTVAENIRFGRPEATAAEIEDAARRLDVLDLLEALPGGLAAEVGERGANLSLGQRQLVCFVRAFLADPRIVVLDEATSAVDARTEERLQRALAALLANRTCFVVAHRLSTIRHAHAVLVLDGGRIVERGTHLALLAQGGLYAHLYRQFAHE